MKFCLSLSSWIRRFPLRSPSRLIHPAIPGLSAFLSVAGIACAAAPDLIIWRDTLNPFVAERNFGSNTCEVIEGCAVYGPRRYLIFGTETRNIGTADLVVGDPRFNTNFTFVSCHGHYHFDAFADYRLVGSAGTGVATGNKVGFCLRDSARFSATAANAARYNCDFQGIQAGWSDVYDDSLPCQWIDITGVPGGLYVLEIEVNPEGRLVESSRSNNITRMSVVIDDPCSGPPANDRFDSPIVLSRQVESAFASTACATKEAGERNHTGRNVTNTVWFRWTAPVSGNVIMTTEGSTFDTLLAVYRGTNHANLTTVDTGNDSGSLRTSRVSFNATSNTTYQMVVAGLGNAPGAVALHVNPGRNDSFADRTRLDGSTGRIAGLNTAATRENQEPLHAGIGGTNSVWYTWLAPADGPVRFDTAGSNFDTVLAVYTGSQLSSLAPVATDHDGGPARTSVVEFQALGGVAYQIAIDATAGNSGFFHLNWGVAGRPRFRAISTTVDGSIQFNLEGLVGQTYDVQISTDLEVWTHWTRITNLLGTTPLLDSATNSSGRRYYRAVTGP